MREIPLTQGYVAIVDDEDFDALSKFKWCALVRGRYVRAARTFKINGLCQTEYLHRTLVDVPPGMVIDHIDGNPLNNSRGNLRVCTQAENLRNRRPADGRSVRGVQRHRRRFRASIAVGGKRFYLGLFPTERDAGLAYDRAAKTIHGDFARLNFPDEAA